MSNTDDLLCLARVMGVDAYLNNALAIPKVKVRANYSGGYEKVFNPVTDDIINLLLEHGKFILLQKDYIIFDPIKGSDIHATMKDFKQNIINIAIQVARYLERK